MFLGYQKGTIKIVRQCEIDRHGEKRARERERVRERDRE